jgi:hypothetical protein
LRETIKYILLAVRSVLLVVYCSGEQIKKNEISRACGMYGREKRFIHGSGGET